jgi:hypothetical protein
MIVLWVVQQSLNDAVHGITPLATLCKFIVGGIFNSYKFTHYSVVTVTFINSLYLTNTKRDLSVTIENLPKKLTNLRYTVLLSVIGTGEQPLSSYEIFKQKGRSKYVYEMIKELTGIPKESFNDMLTNPKYRKRNRELNPEYQREYEQKIKAAARGPRFVTITGDDDFEPRRWKYTLNFRGFLLYLVGESRSKRQDNRRLRKVISNNHVILELAPFLQYWQDFEKSGFDVTGTLREIGMEFQNLLIYNIEYLQRRVTERYFFAVDTYFGRLGRADLFHIYIKNVDRQTHQKLKDYRLKMYFMLNEWHKNEIELNNEMLHIYSEED